MRQFNDILTDKSKILSEKKESQLLESYNVLISALIEDSLENNKTKSINESLNESIHGYVNKYFDAEEGLTEEGVAYLKNRKLSLTESSTTLEKKKFLTSNFEAVINESINFNAIKSNIYAVINEAYLNTKASKLSDVASIEEIEECITESIKLALRDTLYKDFRKEIAE